MGVVGGPKDFVGGRRKFVESTLRDLSPGVKESVIEILKTWEGETSERKLADLVGDQRARRIARSIQEK